MFRKAFWIDWNPPIQIDALSCQCIMFCLCALPINAVLCPCFRPIIAVFCVPNQSLLVSVIPTNHCSFLSVCPINYCRSHGCPTWTNHCCSGYCRTCMALNISLEFPQRFLKAKKLIKTPCPCFSRPLQYYSVLAWNKWFFKTKMLGGVFMWHLLRATFIAICRRRPAQ